jgi:hypothetical protein
MVAKGRTEKETGMAHSMDDAVGGLAKILDPVAACFTPEVAQRIVALRVDPAVHARIALLAEKCNEGTIAPEEMTEYEAYIYRDGCGRRAPEAGEGPPQAGPSDLNEGCAQCAR